MNRSVQRIFSRVAPRYQLVNTVLTLGLDCPWRDRAARIAASKGGARWLDLCTGTGDLALRLQRLDDKGRLIVGLDFTPGMLAIAAAKPGADGIRFVCGDAMLLPFADESFDLVTISFATRNINVGPDGLARCLSEIYRVLRPGGWFVNIETSQPPSRAVRAIVHAYVRAVVPRLGGLISGDRAGYLYLSRTIPVWFDASRFAAVLRDAGFCEVGWEYSTLGVAAAHRARKPVSLTADLHLPALQACPELTVHAP